MTARHEQWALGYAKQAYIDFQTYEMLTTDPERPVAICQSLHLLQMACEKLCKAYLCGNGTDPDQLQTSHAFIAKPLPEIVKQQHARVGGRKRKKSISKHRNQIKHLAREIELLAPTVTDGGRRPDNCEYPWEDEQGVHVPADYDFPNLNLLREPAGRQLLKLIPFAIEELLET